MAIEKFKPVPIQQEPKRNNRFIVEFPKEFGIEPYLVQSATRPKLKINKVEIPYMNTTHYHSGKYEWENIEINLIDVIGPSTTRGVMNLIMHCKTQKLQFIQEELKGASDFRNRVLFSFNLKSLDPVGVEIESWLIEVEELINVDFGNCDYGDDNLQMIKVILRPFSCKLQS